MTLWTDKNRCAWREDLNRRMCRYLVFAEMTLETNLKAYLE